MKTKPNLIYFGSPEFSAAILESILESPDVGVAAIVTSPDRPLGRKQVMTSTPVAQTAQKRQLPVFKPEKLTPENLAHIKLLKPDIFLVVSFGEIIPTAWLTAPTLGTFNLHFSLLPKYRGALCISEAIKNQDAETGVTLMVMDEKLDHGPIIAQAKVVIDINDNNETLTQKLTQAGTKLLGEYLPQIAANNYPTKPQDESAATLTPFTKTRTRQSAYLDWPTIAAAIDGNNASAIHALIRSNNPDPGAWTKIDNLEIKLVSTNLRNNHLEIETVQLPGKQPVSWKQFTSGHQID